MEEKKEKEAISISGIIRNKCRWGFITKQHLKHLIETHVLFFLASSFEKNKTKQSATQTGNPHLEGDTCLVSEKHYYSAITCTGKHHCSLHQRRPGSVEGGKMNSSSSSITLAASYAPQKGGKNGETNGKANQLHEKESCHLSDIHSVLCRSVFFPPSTAAHFLDWILKTLYIINTLHASSVYQGRSFFFCVFFPSLSYTLFLWDKI